jgi:hypothetical protein
MLLTYCQVLYGTDTLSSLVIVLAAQWSDELDRAALFFAKTNVPLLHLHVVTTLLNCQDEYMYICTVSFFLSRNLHIPDNN